MSKASEEAKETDYYVYLILDPTRFYLPFYVGKGKGRRAQTHLTSAYIHNKNKRKIIDEIREAGFEPVIYYWDQGLSEECAYKLEIELIDRFGRKKDGGILTNIARDRRPPGMTGKRHSEETKQEFSRSRKGRQHSPQTKLSMSQDRSGSGNVNSLAWEVITPNGSRFVVKEGLKKWCSENGHQFTKVYNSRSGYSLIRYGTGKGGGRPKGN